VKTPQFLEEGGAWAGRFDYAYPKEELRRKLKALHEDLSTPWTYIRMVRECRAGKIDRRVIERFVNEVRPISEKYQLILSIFVREVEAGRLRVYYKDKEARRWVSIPGQKPKEEDKTHQARVARQKKNKVVREYYPGELPQKPPERTMQVRIGSFGATIRNTQRSHEVNTAMPDFSQVFKR
jgi:hypothetical protein